MKQNNTNRALIAALGLLLVGGVVLTVTLFNTNEPQTTPVDSLAAQLEVPQLTVPIVEPSISEAGIREFFNPEPSQSEAIEDTEQTPELPTNQPTDNAEGEQAGTPGAEAPIENELDYTEQAYYEAEPTVPVFSAFEYGARMAWPVRGEVVMDYSTDRFIFDPTLNLYRTNAIMGIASTEGTPVQAAAEGVISSITNTRREGNKITIDHGNGWSTTYTQLDDIIVSVGDVVVLGEVIAHVARPTIFSSELGENVGIRVTRDNETVNPLYMLSSVD
ncbi:MAG: M23 family metallopeptidase [Defluviitaleaceae bacterium]|nr:M23 family metallopeptidase [Defluviitaleaceae bacterium]